MKISISIIRSLAVAVGAVGFLAADVDAVTVVNSGFEDVSGQSPFNEFTFGEPVGWGYYNPNGIISSAGTYTGTVQLNGVDFFDTAAPDGVKVGILFNERRQGEGEYGYQQTLTDTLEANTDYVLTVEVGNIASGVAQNGAFFNLDEFPGYRVELLAGGIAVAQDDNGLTIPEGTFATSTVSLRVGASHPALGQNLGIRLVSLNVLPAGYTQQNSPDLEVDFDAVALSATPIADRPGDINGDGQVNGTDAALLAAQFGMETGAMWSTGDFNADGATTLEDLAILQAHMTLLSASPTAGATVGATVGATADATAVAEPSSAALLLLCIASAAAFRRLGFKNCVRWRR